MSTHKDCLVCERIDLIKKDSNPYFVTELETGFVVLGDYQMYEGYTLFLCKIHTNELHELPRKYRKKFLEEMGLIGEAVNKAFKPDKINYEALGNNDPHLHWHIFPRYKANDLNIKRTVWVIDESIRYAKSNKPTKKQLAALKKRLLKEIAKVIKIPDKSH